MDILITGGSGFIGQHLVEELSKDQNNHVFIFDKQNSEIKKNNVHYLYQDISSEHLYCIHNIDIIYHLAAQSNVRTSIVEPYKDFQNNLIGTFNVLQLAIRKNVKKFIYTSTGGARYGECVSTSLSGITYLSEDMQCNPKSPYGISKYCAEKYVKYFCEKHDIDYQIYCFGNVYGPGENLKQNRIIPTLLNNMINHETTKIYGDGEQIRDYIYVKDIIKIATILSQKKTKNKIFNIGSGSNYSINNLIQIINKNFNCKLLIEYHPTINEEVKNTNIVLDISRLKKEIPTLKLQKIEEGIQQTYNWILEQNYGKR